MIEIEPISGYPAQCLRGKLGKSEDTWVVEAVYVPTDAMNFLFAISAPGPAPIMRHGRLRGRRRAGNLRLVGGLAGGFR